MDTPHLHNLHKHLIHDLAKEHNLLGGVGWGVGGCQYKRVLFICAIKEVPKSPHTQKRPIKEMPKSPHTQKRPSHTHISVLPKLLLPADLASSLPFLAGQLEVYLILFPIGRMV